MNLIEKNRDALCRVLVDRSTEGLCIDSDMKKWPLGWMEIDQFATRLGQRDVLGGCCANSGINDEPQV